MIRISQAQENFVAAKMFLVPYVNQVKNIIRKQKTSWKPKIWINKQDADLNGYISILLQNHHQTNWFTNT